MTKPPHGTKGANSLCLATKQPVVTSGLFWVTLQLDLHVVNRKSRKMRVVKLFTLHILHCVK